MNIICAGFGGQGVLTAGLIIAKTGVETGKNVTWIPSYGSEMRGGTANCNVKIADGKIASPFVKDIDILLVMNTPSADKFEAAVKPGGTIIYNSTMITDYKFREDVKLVAVEATALADELGNPKGSNIVMLGALGASGALFDQKVMCEGVEEFFASKGKNNPKNAACCNKGAETAKIRA